MGCWALKTESVLGKHWPGRCLNLLALASYCSVWGSQDTQTSLAQQRRRGRKWQGEGRGWVFPYPAAWTLHPGQRHRLPLSSPRPPPGHRAHSLPQGREGLQEAAIKTDFRGYILDPSEQKLGRPPLRQKANSSPRRCALCWLWGGAPGV